MRGFPPVQIFLVALCFVFLAVPLGCLTRSPASAPTAQRGTDSPKADSSDPRLPTRIELRFAHRPSVLRLTAAGRDLLKGVKLDASPLMIEAPLEIEDELIELELIATWPEGTPSTPISVDLEPRGLQSVSLTRWSQDGGIDELLPFRW
jgi:hypothetical protein